MKSAEPNLCVRWEGGEQQSERWCGGELPVIDVPFVDDKGVVGKEERQRIHIAKDHFVETPERVRKARLGE